MKRPRKFMLGGFVQAGMPFRMQRCDQGQDAEIPLGKWLIAPGYCKVLEHNDDAPFPSGFGSPYVSKLRVYTGRFKGYDLYLGHANSNVPPVGKTFRRGQKLVPLTNALNYGWGWVEIGVLVNGQPGPNGTGYEHRRLFRPAWWIA